MNIEKTIKKMLSDNGLLPEQCGIVIDRMKENPANEPMVGRWSDDPEGYPEIIMSLAWMSARDEALKFIDETCPKAWFRSMFVSAESEAS